MINSPDTHAIELIPIERITVINPRVRNKKIFKEIVSNIAELGLKRPITVSRHDDADGPRYALVCGQGRLEAYQALGQQEIPALVVEANTEDCMVMSLVENLARRQHRAIDLLHDIEGLKRRGYNDITIARKTGLTIEYVKAVLRLLHKGEHRLLRAVEANQIPVSIAVEIAGATDAETQTILQQAYEKNLLRGHRLIAAKRLIEQRQRRGKGLKINVSQNGKRRERPLSANALTHANGTAERRAAEIMLKAQSKAAGRRITAGEDKAYDTAGFSLHSNERYVPASVVSIQAFILAWHAIQTDYPIRNHGRMPSFDFRLSHHASGSLFLHVI